MNIYKVDGMESLVNEILVVRALKAHFGADLVVETDGEEREVRVSESADPQIVVFTIEGTGCAVREVTH